MNVVGSTSASSAYAAASRPLAANGAGNAAGTTALSPADAAVVRKLKARDQAVRQHEMAHLAASGGLAVSGASYTYQRGPDGVNYAVGGEVNIDTSRGRTPEETLRRAEIIRNAALAPADPSGQDRAVAAAATQMALQAQTEIARQQVAGAQAGDTGTGGRRADLARTYGGGSPGATPTVDVYA